MTTTLLAAALLLLVLLLLRLIGKALSWLLRLAVLAILVACLLRAYGPRQGTSSPRVPPSLSPSMPPSPSTAAPPRSSSATLEPARLVALR